MSRGLGLIERKIIALLRYGRRPWPLEADHIADRAYPDDRGSHWAQHVAVLRAMRSVARKYPDKYVLRRGKGRAPLVIMPAKDAPEWDEDHAPRRRNRKAGADGAAQAHIRELEEYIDKMKASYMAHDEETRAHLSEVVDTMEQMAARIIELEDELARERTK